MGSLGVDGGAGLPRQIRSTGVAALIVWLMIACVCPADGQVHRIPDVGRPAVTLESQPIGYIDSAIDRPAEFVSMPTGSPVPESFTPPHPPMDFDPGRGLPPSDVWALQWLPDGLIYHSYLAGMKEPRFASSWVHERDQGWLWEITLGGRVAILRYGTDDARWPVGWEVDIEGAAFPRLDPEEHRDLVACDYRFGIPVTYGNEMYRTKLAYYHLSSHLGDEFMLKHPLITRINYSRDVIVWGHSLYLLDQDLRLYFEAGCAFHVDGGAKPWEFQMGVTYSPARSTGSRGAPFVAINGHLREEVGFGGNLVVEAGWQWRGATGRLFRIGSQYYTGMSDQFEFFDQFEDKVGLGVWYDY